MELLGYAWWVLGLVGIGFLFPLLLVCYLMTHFYIHSEEEQCVARSDLDPNYLDSNPMELTSLEPNDLYVPVIRIRRGIFLERLGHTNIYYDGAFMRGGLHYFTISRAFKSILASVHTSSFHLCISNLIVEG